MSDEKKSRLRLRLSDDGSLLAAALAIAFVAWILAKATQTDEARLIVPVEVAPRVPGMEVRVTPPTVPVVLRYPKEAQKDINSENFHFEVDASDLRQNLGLDWKAKTQLLSEDNWVANIPEPGRVHLLRIGTQSKTVEVKLRWNAKPALIEPDIVGQDRLPEGLQVVTPVKVTPKEVWIAGEPEALASIPRDEITSQMKLLTEKINVADRTQSALETVGIKVPGGIEIVPPASKLAEVSLEIQEVRTINEIRGLKLEFEALQPDSVQLDYKEKTATVTVFGPNSLLRQLGPESFEVVLQRPAQEIPGTTKDVELEARLTPSVAPEVRSRLTIRSIEPKSIKIRYTAKGQ
jgi:hypothetical protein